MNKNVAWKAMLCLFTGALLLPALAFAQLPLSRIAGETKEKKEPTMVLKIVDFDGAISHVYIPTAEFSAFQAEVAQDNKLAVDAINMTKEEWQGSDSTKEMRFPPKAIQPKQVSALGRFNDAGDAKMAKYKYDDKLYEDQAKDKEKRGKWLANKNEQQRKKIREEEEASAAAVKIFRAKLDQLKRHTPGGETAGSTGSAKPVAQNKLSSQSVGAKRRAAAEAKKTGPSPASANPVQAPSALAMAKDANTFVAEGSVNVVDTLVCFENAARNSGQDKEAKLKRLGKNNAFLMRFDLSGLNKGAAIQKAEVVFYVFASNKNGNTHLCAYRMLVPWEEESATWAKPGNKDSWEVGEFSIGDDTGMAEGHVTINKSDKETLDPPAEYRIDVTAMVTDWHSGAEKNYGIAISPILDRDVDDGWMTVFRIYTSESEQIDYAPKLVITFQQ